MNIDGFVTSKDQFIKDTAVAVIDLHSKYSNGEITLAEFNDLYADLYKETDVEYMASSIDRQTELHELMEGLQKVLALIK